MLFIFILFFKDGCFKLQMLFNWLRSNKVGLMRRRIHLLISFQVFSIRISEQRPALVPVVVPGYSQDGARKYLWLPQQKR